MKINRLGAIDVGSNSVKLLISDIINNEGKIVYKTSLFTRVPLRLGDDTFSEGCISKEKMDKLAKLVKTFISLIKINNVENWLICATSALREAKNVNEVIDYILSSTGQGIQVISPNEEAYYIGLNLAIRSLEEDRIYVVADVGGGCTELTLFMKNKQPVCNSFNLGTIRCLTRNEELAEWKKLSDWVNRERNGHRELTLIGSGGNINKLNSIFKKKGRIKKGDFNRLYQRLYEMKYEGRILQSDLGLNRSKVIIPAMKIYLQLMKILKKDEIEIPVIGLVDGMIKDLYAKSLNRT